MDFVRRRHVGEQSPGQVLSSYRQGPAATNTRNRQMEQTGRSDCAHSPSGKAGRKSMSRRKRMLEELDQDIRDHIERETQDIIERGMPPEEARYAAIRKFGNVTLVKEETREVWISVWLEQLWQDIRYELSLVRKCSGFAAVAILLLALGV